MKSTMTIGISGIRRWRLPNGDFHRADGPAIEYPNGEKEWYINGKMHRKNGPAWIRKFRNYSTKRWYINGFQHRTNGPAITSKGIEVWLSCEKAIFWRKV